ncbi:MAG: DUF4352 domain-containing protein [Corynebacterium sp.]|uniref:DUF4352 domain-containing protein n=1 Tax=Corynebacterium sp. TaxID=1720 RepID=UPI003F9002AE
MTIRRTALAAIAAGALTLTACGSDEDAEASQETAGETARENSEPEHEQVENQYPLGEEAISGGVSLIVEDVEESQDASIYASGYNQGTQPDEVITAPEGAKFVTVRTTVTNNSRSSWDLTCGSSFSVELLNMEGQFSAPDDEQYRIHGNPECNDSLNPGLSSPMAWRFVVPEDAEPLALSFQDYDLDYSEEPSFAVLAEGQELGRFSEPPR